MSLINQMLNDLDARHAGERPALPNEIRPLPATATGTGGRRLLPVLALLGLATVAALAWFRSGRGESAPAPERIAARPAEMAPPAIPAASAVTAPQVAAPPVAAPVAEAASVVAPPRAEAANPPPVAPEPPRAAVPRSGERDPALRFSLRLSALESRPVTMPTPAAPFASAAPATREAVTAPAASGSISKQERDASPRERAERLYRSALNSLGHERTAEAVEVLRTALREDPSHVAARQALVKVLLDAGLRDAALATLREGLDQVPQQHGWALLASRLQIDRGELDGALKTLEKHENAAAGNAEYQGTFGAVLHRLARYADAERHYAASARLEPANGRWWVGRGMALEALSRGGEARDAFTRARETGTLAPDLAAFVEQKLK